MTFDQNIRKGSASSTGCDSDLTNMPVSPGPKRLFLVAMLALFLWQTAESAKKFLSKRVNRI